MEKDLNKHTERNQTETDTKRERERNNEMEKRKIMKERGWGCFL